MNDEVQKQLLQQLKIIKFWMTLFGTLFFVTILIISYLLFRVFTFVKNTSDSVDKIKGQASSLNIKNQVCEGTTGFSDLVKNKTDACN